MKKILIYIVTFLLFMFGVSFGAGPYYIDPEAAQGGAGTEIDPYNNFNEDITPACGNTVYFKKGTVHRDNIKIDSLTCTSGNEFVLDDYGTGDTPIVTGRNRTTSAWTGPDGSGNYYLDVGVSIYGFWAGNSDTDTWGEEIGQHPLSGTIAYTTNPVDGSWSRSGSVIYYDPSASQPVPGSANFFAEYSENDSGKALSSSYISSSSYIIINDIDFVRARYHGSVVAGSSHITHNRCSFSYNGTGKLNYQAGGFESIGNGVEYQVSTSCVVNDSEANWNFDNGLGYEDNYINPITDIIFNNCKGNYNGSSGGYVKADNANPNYSGYATFINCEFAYNGNPSLDHIISIPSGANHYSFSGVKFYKNSAGMLKGCYIHDNEGSGVRLEVNGESGWTMLIQNNIIVNNGQAHGSFPAYVPARLAEIGGIAIHDSFDSGTVRIYGNTIADDHNGPGIFQSGGTDLADLYIENNIITGNAAKDVRIESDSVTVDIDNNLYSASFNNYLGADTYICLNGDGCWNTVTGVGTDFSGNPYFDTDYTLLSNSPAIDTGTNLGATYDDAIDPDNFDFSSTPIVVTLVDQDNYGTGWEMGAFISTGDTGPEITNTLPAAAQACDGVASTDEISLDVDRDSTCRASRKGTDTCATAYADLDVVMVDEGANHHTFTGSGLYRFVDSAGNYFVDSASNYFIGGGMTGEPGYKVTCGTQETVVVICQDDSTSEYSSCSEWSYEVNPLATGVIAQRHPKAWASIAQIHPKAIADIAQIHPIVTSAESGGVACDVCEGQDLMFAWHMENNDSTPDVTIHDVITDPCGCSDGDTIGAGNEFPVFSENESDGSYSLYIGGLDDRYDFTVSAKNIVDPDDIKMTFDIYVEAYPSAGYAEVIRASYNADNNMVVWVTSTETVKVVHIGGGNSDDVEVSVATGSFVSCEYQAKQGVAGNDHYLICGVTSDEDDDDLTATAGSASYLQIGDHYGSNTASYYIDNVKIYPSDKY